MLNAQEISLQTVSPATQTTSSLAQTVKPNFRDEAENIEANKELTKLAQAEENKILMTQIQATWPNDRGPKNPQTKPPPHMSIASPFHGLR